MRKEQIEIIFDNNGNYIYYIENMYLSPYMYYLYKVIKSTEQKFEMAKMLSLDNTKYIKKIQSTKEELEQLLIKDDNATVGPFFFINDKIYSKNKKLSEFDNNLKIFDNEISYDEWFHNEIIFEKELNLKSNSDYSTFLRGRVLYDNKNNIFKIYTNPRLLIKPLFFEKLLKHFNINCSNAPYLLLFDEHYLLDEDKNEAK